MKKPNSLWGMLTIALIQTLSLQAQEPEPLNCEEKAIEILKFQKTFPLLSRQELDTLIEYITPCAEENYGATTPSAAYAKGLLHFQNGDYAFLFNRNVELSRLHIIRAALNDYPPAMLTHSINTLSDRYEETYTPVYRNIAQDLEALIRQDYKPNVAHYLLGYLNLKNYINQRDTYTSNQGINVAKSHFENSDLPIAKHWLAIMYYFGYGVPQDRAKALQMLTDNDLLNSQQLKQQLETHAIDWIPISAQERVATIDAFSNNRTPITLLPVGNHQFTGKLLEFDWAAKGVKQVIPVKMKLNILESDSQHKPTTCEIRVNEQVFTQNQNLVLATHQEYGYILHFYRHANFEFQIDNVLKDHPDKEKITYRVDKLDFKESIIDGKKALIAAPTRRAEILEFDKERVYTPIRFVLYPDTPTNELTEVASRSINNEPLQLDPNFAKVTNPIGDSFDISYTLPQSADVQIAVYDMYKQEHLTVSSTKHTTHKQQVVTVDSSALPSGSYILQMTIDGKPYSKIIIKL